MIKECPNCKSKNVTMIKTTGTNSNCFALLSAEPKANTIKENEVLLVNAYACNDCHFISLFAPLENQNDNQ